MAKDEILIRWAHTAYPGNLQKEAIDMYAKKVTERTNGRVKFQIYPSASLGSDKALFEQCQAGGLDMACASDSNLTDFTSASDHMEFHVCLGV